MTNRIKNSDVQHRMDSETDPELHPLKYVEREASLARSKELQLTLI